MSLTMYDGLFNAVRLTPMLTNLTLTVAHTSFIQANVVRFYVVESFTFRSADQSTETHTL